MVIDVANSVATWGNFEHGYEDRQDPHVIASLFDSTMTHLQTVSDGTVCTVDDLPILRAIGPYRSTRITRHPDRTLTIEDADAVPFSAVAGLA